jgi:hypothetical protein
MGSRPALRSGRGELKLLDLSRKHVVVPRRENLRRILRAGLATGQLLAVQQNPDVAETSEIFQPTIRFGPPSVTGRGSVGWEAPGDSARELGAGGELCTVVVPAEGAAVAQFAPTSPTCSPQGPAGRVSVTVQPRPRRLRVTIQTTVPAQAWLRLSRPGLRVFERRRRVDAPRTVAIVSLDRTVPSGLYQLIAVLSNECGDATKVANSASATPASDMSYGPPEPQMPVRREVEQATKPGTSAGSQDKRWLLSGGLTSSILKLGAVVVALTAIGADRRCLGQEGRGSQRY